jgi:hypothetical protein
MFSINPKTGEPEFAMWITSLVDIAAELSGYSPQYLRRLLRDGEIIGEKRRGVWVVDYLSLRDYMDRADMSHDRRMGSRSRDKRPSNLAPIDIRVHRAHLTNPPLLPIL